MLVHLHHKVEKWATAKLVEKNKQIRPAAERKQLRDCKQQNQNLLSMKKLIFFFLSIICVNSLIAQAPQIDSLNKLLATTKEDTTKVNVLVKLSFYNQNFQHALYFSEQALPLARKIKYEKGEANALNQIGYQYEAISNYPRALYYFVEALKIREHINDTNGIAGSNEAIGTVYMQQGDFEKALMYYRKANAMYRNDVYRLAVLHGELGSLFISINKQDSALKYYQSSYEYFNKISDKYQYNLTLLGLGYLQLAMSSRELALGYYREAVKNGNLYNDTLGLSYTYLDIANYYDAQGKPDSCIVYARKSLFLAQKSVLENVIKSGKLLSKLYTNKDDKEALKYLQIAQTANDSLFSRERTMEIQNMTFNETQRENELSERERKEAEERIINIQFALIAFGIISFIIVFLLLSRSFITNTKLIEFFGVIALLIVFEFLNLLLHPFLERITNHSPVLMLLALVCIAALLVPLHHKLEKWATTKLVEKNKKIRLASAKRTVEELEKKDGESL